MIQATGITAHNQVSKNKSRPYEKINGCTNSMPLWQAIALAVLVAIEILNFDLIRSMVTLNSTLLYVLFGINFILAIFVGIDYVILMLGDPSDPRLYDPSYSEPNETLVDCHDCQAKVSQKSYHCKTCNRCVDQFDHHCVFLNNCIGKQNYSTFFRLLLTTICHMSLNMGIGLSMFVQLDDSFKWIALAFTVLSFLVFAEITVLAVFHCYISFCLFKSTIEVLRGEKARVSDARQIQVRCSNSMENKGGPKMTENLVQETTQVAINKPKIAI